MVYQEKSNGSNGTKQQRETKSRSPKTKSPRKGDREVDTPMGDSQVAILGDSGVVVAQADVLSFPARAPRPAASAASGINDQTNVDGNPLPKAPPPSGSGGVSEQALDFEKLFEAKSAGFVNHIKDQIADGTTSLVKSIMGEAVGALNKKINHVEAKVDNVETKVDDLSEKLDKVLKRFDEFDNEKKGNHGQSGPMYNGQSYGRSSQAPPPSPSPSVGPSSLGAGVAITLSSSGGFFRTTDPTILFANTSQDAKVSLGEFHKSFSLLAKDVNLEDDKFVITGDPLDSRFKIQFQGTNPTLSAKTLYQSLYLGKGEWKEQSVLSPAGKVQFFVNPDKNLSQIRKEILSKKLAVFLQPHVLEAEVSAQRAAGFIKLNNKRRLATLVIKDEFTYAINWDPTQAHLCKLDTATLETAFRNEVGLLF